MVASAGETVNRATHTTPAVTVPTDGSWVVSYWADKSSATNGWTLPGSETLRGAATGTGTGRVTSVASDRGESLPDGLVRRPDCDRRLELGEGHHVVDRPEARERSE